MYAALVLTAGASGLAVSSASAAPASPTGQGISVLSTLDSLGVAPVPAKYQSQMPTVTGQLTSLQHLHDLGQLHQVTDLAAPVAGLLPVVA